jgi:UPF0755 protein
MKKSKRFILYPLLFLALAATLISAGAWYWAERPVELKADKVDFIVESGARPRTIARIMNKEGVHINEDAFVMLSRLSGRDKSLQAGAYEVQRGDSPRQILDRMAAGDMTQARLTLVEGWSYKRIRAALKDAPEIKQTLGDISDADILQRLGADYASPEGLFFPDTYVFVPGTSDFDILRRAYHAQQQILLAAWSERDPEVPLQNPYQALILASIIEKETGHGADRDRVAGVFANRLRIGMPLQTDPTVIYGMGDIYQGRIRKKDLTTDTPWNTYTRAGLPPTPIASSGRAALLAALHPETHRFLYFVSRGDGTSEFSENLPAHNRAVAKYILGRRN